jgi:hypothetical protein
MPGTRAYIELSGRFVEVEVIYVRPPQAGRARVMLRRHDNRKILYQPRTLDALFREKPRHGRPTVAKAKR